MISKSSKYVDINELLELKEKIFQQQMQEHQAEYLEAVKSCQEQIKLQEKQLIEISSYCQSILEEIDKNILTESTMKSLSGEIKKLNNQNEEMEKVVAKLTKGTTLDEIRNIFDLYLKAFDIHVEIKNSIKEKGTEVVLYFKEDLKIIKFPIILFVDGEYNISEIKMSFDEANNDKILIWYRNGQRFVNLLQKFKQLLMDFIAVLRKTGPDVNIYL